VFVLLEFFSRSNDQNIRMKTLTAIGECTGKRRNENIRCASGHFCAQYSEYLGRNEIKNIYLAVMQSKDPNFKPLKIQVG